MQNRPESGLFSPENFKNPSSVSATNLQRGGTRNDLSSFRLEHGSQDFLHTNQLDRPSFTSAKEHSNYSLFGRHFSGSSKRRCFKERCRNNLKCSSNTGMVRQLGEIRYDPTKKYNIPWCNVENLGQFKIIAMRKNIQAQEKDKSNPESATSYNKRSSEPCRNVELRQLCGPKRQAASSSALKVHEFDAEASSTRCDSPATRSRRTKLVAAQLSVTDNPSLPPSDTFPYNRRIRRCVGCPIRQHQSIGPVVSKGEKIALQSKGNACNLTCHSVTWAQPQSQLCPNTMRQSNGSSPSKERGGDKISIIDGINPQTVNITRPVSNCFHHSPYSGKIQQSCRPPIKASTSTGMALNATLSGNNFQQMGNSTDRSFCIRQGSRGSQLRVIGSERPKSAVLRCVQRIVELPTGVDISPSISGAKSTVSPQPIEGSISFSSASLAESVLAGRPQNESLSGPANPEKLTPESNRHVNRSPSTERARPNSRGMEMWGWTEDLNDWSGNQITLLKGSWRSSTLKTYKVAWERWLSWAKRNNVNFKKPNGSQLAQFLADLHLFHGLSYNTILLHKSVVSTLCSAEMSSQLSSHVLVRHILKSISLKNPRSMKSPIWDIDVLVQYLLSYSIDINNCYQISRHTAILLLLCSGRRVHDLTLLKVDLSHCVKSNDSIIFWPEFGSKTDKGDYQQSGWKLMANKSNQQLDPVFWINRTISLLKERRDAAKSTNLFITVRGLPKAASRAVIAGWLRHLFKDANINFTPGSTRSAVASKNWLNYPLDEILSRGNWRSANTFQKYYKREIIPMNTSDSTQITKLFQPVN